VGYTQATTRHIAAAAGVNEVTLFRRFGSKKNLLLACIQAFNATGFAAAIDSGLTGDYPADLWRMADRQITDTLSKLDALRLIVCDSRTVPELREAVLAGARANLALLSAYFQRQIQAGVVRPDLDPQVLAFAFDSLFSTSLIFESMFQQPLTARLSVAARLHPLVDLFVRATQVAVPQKG
jgi:TetR/AcrR family transcriptional regulator, mexJK operon transcriptional repressor